MTDRRYAAQLAESLKLMAMIRERRLEQLNAEQRTECLIPETWDNLAHEHDAILLGMKALMYLLEEPAYAEFPIRLADVERLEAPTPPRRTHG